MKAVLVVVFLSSCGPKMPARPHQLHPISSPSGIDVDIEPDGFTAWTVRAANQRDVPIRLLWDESTFVGADGRSYGRLLRGNTKLIDVAKAQLPTTIVAGAFIDQWCIPEDLTDAAPRTTKEGGVNFSGMDPVRKGVGRMVLVFETASGRETWEGALSFDGSKPPAQRPRSTPNGPAETQPPTVQGDATIAPPARTPSD